MAKKEKRCSSCKHCVLKKSDVVLIRTSSGCRFDTQLIHVCEVKDDMKIKKDRLDDITFCKDYYCVTGKKSTKRKSGSDSTYCKVCREETKLDRELD